jgi:hypothetical protein
LVPAVPLPTFWKVVSLPLMLFLVRMVLELGAHALIRELHLGLELLDEGVVDILRHLDPRPQRLLRSRTLSPGSLAGSMHKLA